MTKLRNVWVVASSKSAVLELCNGARQFGDTLTLLTWNKENALCADKAYYFGCETRYIDCLQRITELALTARPALILVELSRNGRLAAAHLAVAFSTSVLTDISEMWLDGERIVSRRMVYGGAAYQTIAAQPTAIACIGAGVFEPAQASACAVAEELIAGKLAGVQFVESQPRQVQSVNLSAAKKVVGVGRGIGSAEKLSLIHDFAAAIGAEIACSRPVAEEERWLPRERYIGVSGVMLKPDVYIAVGISGQIQHMVGVNSAGTIVAVNKDKMAPIFSNCDYGIIGDLNKVLPALIDKLHSH